MNSVRNDGKYNLEHDLWDSIPFGKCLRYQCDHLGESFDNLCDLNPDFISLFGNELKFHIFNSNRSKMIKNLAFSFGSDKVLDLSEITDTNSLFRFQAVYEVGSDGPKLIFDSGASISVTPISK